MGHRSPPAKVSPPPHTHTLPAGKKLREVRDVLWPQVQRCLSGKPLPGLGAWGRIRGQVRLRVWGLKLRGSCLKQKSGG